MDILAARVHPGLLGSTVPPTRFRMNRPEPTRSVRRVLDPSSGRGLAALRARSAGGRLGALLFLVHTLDRPLLDTPRLVGLAKFARSYFCRALSEFRGVSRRADFCISGARDVTPRQGEASPQQQQVPAKLPRS